MLSFNSSSVLQGILSFLKDQSLRCSKLDVQLRGGQKNAFEDQKVQANVTVTQMLLLSDSSGPEEEAACGSWVVPVCPSH